jgi:hypothetical protein
MGKKEVNISENPKINISKKEKPVVEKKEKQHNFPKLLIFYGFILIAVSVVNYFNFFIISEICLNVLFLIAGLWMMKLGVAKGFYHKRKEIFKKYI